MPKKPNLTTTSSLMRTLADLRPPAAVSEQERQEIDGVAVRSLEPGELNPQPERTARPEPTQESQVSAPSEYRQRRRIPQSVRPKKGRNTKSPGTREVHFSWPIRFEDDFRRWYLRLCDENDLSPRQIGQSRFVRVAVQSLMERIDRGDLDELTWRDLLGSNQSARDDKNW